jgi:hypothetical protein
MNRVSYVVVTSAILFVASIGSISTAQETPDSCAQGGVYIANLTDLDLWIKRDGGACTLWRHIGFNIPIRPGESIEIFSDLNCQTAPCDEPLTYPACKSVDKNGDCIIKIDYPCKLLDV